MTRREFLSATLLAPVVVRSAVQAADKPETTAPAKKTSDAVIDIHQHTNYSGRSNAQLIAHQRALGISTTVLLPAGSKFGLAAGCGGNDTVVALAEEYPDEFVYFANEITDAPNARDEIAKYLQKGARGIGEQKFDVPCDSPALEAIAELAQEFDVPVLMHFQHDAYNVGIQNFGRILKKFPKVNFIGHAQTWWGHVDKQHDPKIMYPTGPVTEGGITDRLLRDYPNMHGDLSAGSGLNFLIRDENHAAAFLDRHQNQLMFGTDCNDPFGRGPGCQGARTLAVVRRLTGPGEARNKILHRNAQRLLKLG